jgi:uncharacterized damage-inducible protein DinB
MHRRVVALLILILAPAAAAAQGAAAMKPLYVTVRGYLIKSAEMMPEASYSFKPTPAVRSFGEILGHLANENYLLCSTAKGEPNPIGDKNYEKTTNKAALVQALKDAFAYCDAVYDMPDADLAGTAVTFGMTMSRLSWAFLNVTHDNEHYGNLVTYFRLKGMVPPSSAGSSM